MDTPANDHPSQSAPDATLGTAPGLSPGSVPGAAARSAGIPVLPAVSFALTLILCLATLRYGLLPGLLAVCVGQVLTRWLCAPLRPARWRLRPALAAGLVIVLPVLGLVLLLVNAQGMALGAVAQYQALLRHLAGTVLEIRQKLPPDLASHLPDEVLAAQTWLAQYLQSQAHALTGFGTAGLRGGLLSYIGLMVGALLVGTKPGSDQGALRQLIRLRGTRFMDAFRRIVMAQVWIAAFNAFCTGLFLLVALPLAGITLPYTGTLVVLTFVTGLVPIVGNLVCNSVITLTGVSISPAVGLACLLFLVFIHKAEYFINAKIIGKRTNTSAWELLTVMFVGEAIFGVSGLVAAPLYYAYVKIELLEAGLI